jgi:site-specific recombinase XerD
MVSKLRPFVRWLVKTGHLPADVTAEIRTPKGVYGLPRCLPVDAVARILAVCPDARARLVVTLMVQMGLRCGEVAAIQIGDVDFERRILHIRGKGYRGDTSRAVPITDEAWSALQSYLDDDMPARGPLKRKWQPAAIGRARSSGALIRSYQPPYGHVTSHTLSALVRRWMSAAGLKNYAFDGVSAHSFRHTAAQDVLDSGADLRHVMVMLGHRSLRTTQEYLRLDPPGLREAMEGRRYTSPRATS